MHGHSAFRSGAATLALLACLVSGESRATWAEARAGAPAEATSLLSDDARIANQPVCVASRVWSAGQPAPTLVYRTERVGDRLFVGYFVHWTTERPWGNNLMTYTVVPALAVDLVYSHFLLVFSGIRDALYGPDDVEGVTVEYRVRGQSLDVVGGIADDGNHHRVQLSRSELVDAQGRVDLLTAVWSHQLGADGAAAYASDPAHALRCYAHQSVVPLTEQLAHDFDLGSRDKPRRAKPAWLGSRAFQ